MKVRSEGTTYLAIVSFHVSCPKYHCVPQICTVVVNISVISICRLRLILSPQTR